jgi:hypothetical protein
MFADKASAYLSEAPFRCSTLGYAPGLSHKHQTRLERLVREKQSSLLQKSLKYSRKKFYATGPRNPQSGVLYETRVEVTNSEKHFSLLRYGMDYCNKKFYSKCPWCQNDTNLLSFVTNYGAK